MAYRLTHHARDRMRRYHIRETDVARVLKAPDRVEPGVGSGASPKERSGRPIS